MAPLLMGIETERTPEAPASTGTFALNEEFRKLVGFDWQISGNMVNCQRAAIVLAVDIWAIIAIVRNEIPLDRHSLDQFLRWNELGRPCGEYELPTIPPGQYNYGVRGVPETFRNVMDGVGYNEQEYPYYYGGSILGVGQGMAWSWYWGDTYVPSIACTNLAAARRAGYKPPYAAPNLQHMKWKRKAYPGGIFR